MGQTIDIKTDAGSGFTGYLALPESKKGPGILLVQEIFGVNSHIRSVADLYAEAGFVVLAPDVFWRAKPHVELGYTPEEVQQAMQLMQKSDRDQIIKDLGAALQTLRARPEFAGKVGVVGYCMGGHMAYRLATRDLVDCAVSYYGGGIDGFLNEANDLHCPIIMHFGEKDSHITMPVVEKIRQALEGKGHVEIYVYPGADHGFNCDQRASYDRKSAMLAFGRSLVLLKNNLC
ncbi:MAG TPA: dienelactone hydrolase family protein [Oculatellaceae cyanobacterium]